jgi:uncharacterized repeat protein (TIGR03803 family)
VLYGTTAVGAPQSGGTVFSITTSGAEKVLYGFEMYSGVKSGLTDVNGVLYDTTALGSSFGTRIQNRDVWRGKFAL